MELVALLSVQPYWYMWSLSDEEVREFFLLLAQLQQPSTDQFKPSLDS